MKTPRLTQQWRYAFRDGVGHAEGQQQDADHRGRQPSHDEVEVDVSDSVSVHLQREYFRPGFNSTSLHFVPSTTVKQPIVHTKQWKMRFN